MTVKFPTAQFEQPARPREVLSPGEKLLLQALRSWAGLRSSGERPNVMVARALSFRASDRVAALFTAWVQAIEMAGRRPIRMQCPSCGGPSTDEQRLLVALGVAPVAFEIGERVLEPLLTETKPVMVLGRALNAALAAAGFPIPARLTDPPFGPVPAPPTVH